MRLTNNYKLPDALFNYVKDKEEKHEIKENRYSTTEILASTREIILSRRHDNKIVVDISDMISAMFGSAVHKLLECHTKEGLPELKLEYTFENGLTLVGVIDNYNENEFLIEDYKTCSSSKITRGDFEDWRNQGLIYAWFVWKVLNKYVSRLKFHAFIKDWNRHKVGINNYPEKAFYTYEYEIGSDDLKNIEGFITDKLNELYNSITLSDDELPLCTDEERWYSGNEYAVYKTEDSEKASRVFTNEQDANNYVSEKGGIVKVRKGEYVKCNNYCDCCEFCNQYRR